MFFVDLKDYSTSMKIRIFLSILAFCGLISGYAHSQGKIVLLNGKERRFSTAEVKGEVIVYQVEDTTKNKTKKVDRYDVFAIFRDSGVEEIIYTPDTVADEEPSVAEVRDYINGHRYANLTYRKPANFVTGLEVGVVSGFALPVFYGFGVPILYSVGLSQFTPKLKGPLTYNYNSAKDVLEPLPTDSATSNIHVTEAFSAGYGKKARNLKFKNSLIGGGIGFAIGASAIAIIKAL